MAAIIRSPSLRWLVVGIVAVGLVAGQASWLVGRKVSKLADDGRLGGAAQWLAAQPPARLVVGVSLSLLAVLVCLAALRFRNPAWLVASVVGAALLVASFGGPMVVAAMLVAPALAGMRFSPGAGVPFVVGAIGAYYAAIAAGHPPATLGPSYLLWLWGPAAAYVTAYGVRLLREEKERTQAALARVQASQQALLEAAATAERLRVAREMHDVLGHTFAALAVQLEGARGLLERRSDRQAALAAMARAHQLASEGMHEARRAIGALRGEDLPGPDLLPGLVAEFRRSSRAEARLEIDGEPPELAADVRLALYRTAQEALTNVHKHAHATYVCVRLAYERGDAVLTIENDDRDGGREGLAVTAAGRGLIGMRERAELLGGSLVAGATGTGFRVRLTLPAGRAA
jgi:signal transduction histidine kinase